MTLTWSLTHTHRAQKRTGQTRSRRQRHLSNRWSNCSLQVHVTRGRPGPGARARGPVRRPGPEARAGLQANKKHLDNLIGPNIQAEVAAGPRNSTTTHTQKGTPAVWGPLATHSPNAAGGQIWNDAGQVGLTEENNRRQRCGRGSQRAELLRGATDLSV